MIRRIVGVMLVSALLAACSTSSAISNGDQTGFVSADGTAVVKDIQDRGNTVNLSAYFVGTEEPWTLDQHLGSVIILNAWGPWCAPCRKELPELQKIYTEFSGNGLVMVGLATRTNATSTLAYTKKFNITYPQLADYDSAALAQIPGIPSTTVPGTVFIDRKGRVAGWALGAADPALIRSITESLLEEKS